jgi:hypothetical protein
MWRLGLVLMMPLSLFAQELVYEFHADSTQYDIHWRSGFAVILPEIDHFTSPANSLLSASIWTKALKQKNVHQWDIFSFNGKIGTATISPSVDSNARLIVFSQKLIDNDDGWEYLAILMDGTFEVWDDNGKKLLSDSGEACYGYDGQNTYVFTENYNEMSAKVWKFRSNVSAQSPGLAKSTSSTPAPIMSLTPSGNFRVSLQPASGGTSVQIFDMLGRQVFGKIIQDIKTPTSFVIPSKNVPSSPFIAKVNNSNGSFFKANIPVR